MGGGNGRADQTASNLNAVQFNGRWIVSFIFESFFFSLMESGYLFMFVYTGATGLTQEKQSQK